VALWQSWLKQSRSSFGVMQSMRDFPAGWTYEDSLSAGFQFVANEEMDEKLKFLRHEDGMDVYQNLSTGKEVFVGRAHA
jgi:hypothetical protein